MKNLCFGGGVALNGVANYRILKDGPFENIFLQPAPHDAGCSIGSALLVDSNKKIRNKFWSTLY